MLLVHTAGGARTLEDNSKPRKAPAPRPSFVDLGLWGAAGDEGARLMQGMEPSEVDVAALHHVERASLATRRWRWPCPQTCTAATGPPWPADAPACRSPGHGRPACARHGGTVSLRWGGWAVAWNASTCADSGPSRSQALAIGCSERIESMALMRKRRAAPKFPHPPRGARRAAAGLGALSSSAATSHAPTPGSCPG